MKTRSLYSLVALFMLCHWQTLHAQTNANRLAEFLDGLQTMTADFKQTLVNAQGQVLEEASGIVYMQNPGKFHWAYKQPYLQSVITDGVTLWLYDEDLEQVTIKDVAGSMDNTPAAILSGSENINAHFLVMDNGVIEGIHLFELVPKDTDNQFQNIRIGFHGRNVSMMVLYDNLGQITRIDFSNAVRNEPVDQKLFRFTPPAGVDVVDGREAASQ